MEWSEILPLMATYGLPVLPYALVALVTHQLMYHLVKPTIVAHKDAEGYYSDKTWRIIRRLMITFPMIIGFMCGVPFGLEAGYSIGAGACAQMLYFVARDAFKDGWGFWKDGITIDKENPKSLIIPPDKNPVAEVMRKKAEAAKKK